MKRCISILLALLLCLSLFACGQQEETAGDTDTSATNPSGDAPSQQAVATDPGAEPATPPESQPEAPDETAQPTAPPDGPVIPAVELTGGMPHFFPDENDQLQTLAVLNTTLPSCADLPLVNAYYETLKADLISTYSLNTEDAARQKAELEQSGLVFSPWDIRADSQITRNDGVTLSVLRTVTEEWVEHEVLRYHAETFDVASQGRLVLGDLFTVGEDQYLSRLPRDQLAGTVDTLNFALTDDSLVLCTPQGTVTVPLSDLSDILRPQYAGA